MDGDLVERMREGHRAGCLRVLGEMERAWEADTSDLWRRKRGTEAVGRMRRLVAGRLDHKLGFSTWRVLVEGARGTGSDAVKEEVEHLVRAVEGGWGAHVLGGGLDEVGRSMDQWMERYRSGLDRGESTEQARRREIVRKKLGGSERDWWKAQWQVANAFGRESVEELVQMLGVRGEGERALRAVRDSGVPFALTPHYVTLMRGEFDVGQTEAQVLPPMAYVREMEEHGDRVAEYYDLMGERAMEPVARVARRYPKVAILKAINTCPQICTYCQRNWSIEQEPMVRERGTWKRGVDRALDWFEAHGEVEDVLVTGGDPLFLEDEEIAYLAQRLRDMDHVRNVRWGTRAPVTVPMRINRDLGRILSLGGKGCVVTHIESAAEVTWETVKAVKALRDEGVRVYNQHVYVARVSRRFELCKLRRVLKTVGIEPYYTFYMKGRRGLDEYRVPVARMMQEREEEARLMSGMFRTDKSVYNVPGVGKTYIRATGDREWVGLRPDGRRVYAWYPWSKALGRGQPVLMDDVPILDYVERLVDMGERREDYESVWYYE